MHKSFFAFMILIVCLTLASGCCRRTQTLEDASKAYLAGNYDKAAEIFHPKAQSGDPEAQVNIAFMYYCGLGKPRNLEKAVEYYTKSAQQGNMTAQFSLGTLYENGEGVEQNFAQAFFWYSLAEKQGDNDAARLRKEIEPRIEKEELELVKQKLQAWLSL